MAVNKVIYDGKTIMDVTGDTVTPETLAEGATATNARGEKILGMMKAGGGGGKRTCRFIIGTSTAGWTEADCDYLCDGTADDVEINAAIQALPATGGEIVILDGSYNIAAEILVNKENVKISGNDNATVLNREWEESDTGVIAIAKSYVIISDLKINGNKTRFFDSDGIRVKEKNLTDIKIINNTCSNNENHGIFADYIQNSIITGNICDGNDSHGISVMDSQNNIIISNICNNNGSCGIPIGSAQNCTITGNICNNNFFGLNIYSAEKCTITGNTCNDNSRCGIEAGTAQNCTITGNTCICGTGQSSDYIFLQCSIKAEDATKCVIVGNNCAGKAPVTSGTGNIVANNVE